jgi:predicted nucleic acid-binding protein
MSRLYLDSAPVIYFVERVPQYWGAVQGRLLTPGVVLVSSDLTRMECLVRPLRLGDAAVIQDFDSFFLTQVAEMVSFVPPVFRRAAEIRAQFNFKTPDALHLAAAVASACDVFLTNDARLTRFTGMTVEVI